MCTAITLKNGDLYFGRNMDIGYAFGERVVITPKKYPITYKFLPTANEHHSMIGMAAVDSDYPLYAEAVSEKGLCVAALNFPGYAYYHDTPSDNHTNLAPYEFIPWALATFETVEQVKAALNDVRFVGERFRAELPLSTLHWMVSDRHSSIVVESTVDGIKVYDNPVGVMTNNPDFSFHLTNLSNYLNCTPHDTSENGAITSLTNVKALGVGSGTLGLPGDSTTTSRFIRAVFHKSHGVSDIDEESNLSLFFHILGSVNVLKGAAITSSGVLDYTTYSCCVNADKGIYYYKTYGNSSITAVSLHGVSIDGNKLVEYALRTKQHINFEN